MGVLYLPFLRKLQGDVHLQDEGINYGRPNLGFDTQAKPRDVPEGGAGKTQDDSYRAEPQGT